VLSSALMTLPFNGVKVFAATMFAQREQLGDRVTDWISTHPDYKISEIVVRQSSDSEFHCVSFTVFYLS
jgi:putative lipoic acid-binding regulatory protein